VKLPPRALQSLLLVPMLYVFNVYIWRNESYKLLERVTLQRISPDVEEILDKDQAGFRPDQGAA